MSQPINPIRRTWQEIATEASQEQDSEKLMALAEELNDALGERDRQLRAHASPMVVKTDHPAQLDQRKAQKRSLLIRAAARVRGIWH